MRGSTGPMLRFGTAGLRPMPARGTRCWLPLALSVTVRRPLRAPATVGRNETVTLHVAPVASVAPTHVLAESRKSVGFRPVTLTAEIVRLDDPLLEMMTT